MKDKKVSKTTKIFKKFSKSKGVYITLVVLAVIVGFGIYASRIKSDISNDVASFDEAAWQEAVKDSGIEVIDVDNSADEKSVTDTEKKEPVQPDTKTEDAAVSDETVETSAEPEYVFAMERPCTGAVIAECSVDQLVYSSTMKDWRTHNGIDVAASVGDPVKAAEAGIISEVYRDELLGVVVVVDHRNGISSLYGNLQNSAFIKPGTAVNRGDIIGGVGEPGALEADADPHLHFEVTVNGEYKNPEEYINF